MKRVFQASIPESVSRPFSPICKGLRMGKGFVSWIIHRNWRTGVVSCTQCYETGWSFTKHIHSLHNTVYTKCVQNTKTSIPNFSRCILQMNPQIINRLLSQPGVSASESELQSDCFGACRRWEPGAHTGRECSDTNTCKKAFEKD